MWLIVFTANIQIVPQHYFSSSPTSLQTLQCCPRALSSSWPLTPPWCNFLSIYYFPWCYFLFVYFPLTTGSGQIFVASPGGFLNQDHLQAASVSTFLSSCDHVMHTDMTVIDSIHSALLFFFFFSSNTSYVCYCSYSPTYLYYQLCFVP